MARRSPPSKKAGLAKLSLGLSLFGAGASIAYFWWRGDVLTGVGLALLFVAAGVWEYRAKRLQLFEEERAEAEAEERRSRRRQ